MFILQPHRHRQERRFFSANHQGNSSCGPPVSSTFGSLPSFIAEPLGRPLPLDEHACSVSLPTWSSVVGYEEGNPAITSQMSCGYPRFVYHPYILQLMDYVIQHYGTVHQDCLLLPTAEAAARCQTFLHQALYGTNSCTDNARVDANTQTDKITRLQITDHVHAVLFPAETLAGTEAKAYWQHTGEIVSSRRAEVALMQLFKETNNNKDSITTPTNNQNSHHSTDSPATTTTTIQDPHDDVILRRVTVPHLLSPSAQPLVHHTAYETCESVYGALRERIAQLTHVPPSHVHLVPSGMASIYTALRASRRLKQDEQLQKQQQQLQSNPSTTHKTSTTMNGGTSIVFGFPYLDTLKLCSRKEFCPGGVEFFGMGDETDLEHLETLLLQSSQGEPQQQDYCALFTEIPSNPLLQTPNVHKLRDLATRHNFALVVDDTIGNFANIRMLERTTVGENGGGSADAICTSLTKLFSGRGDVMAGSLVTNPNTETGVRLQADLERQQESCGLFPADAWAIYHNSHDFLERNAQINETCEQLSDWLTNHKDVEKVYYPKYTKFYHQVSTGRGYGGLLSILLEQHVCQRTFYDALDISKGPSLGTNFSLMCPYTLLAHYHELDFAMTYNVQPNLLRIAIGLEPLDVLKQRFELAFEKSRLHPPLPKLGQQKRMYSTISKNTTPRWTRVGFEIGKRLFR
jgi:cystathionine gamma-synthase